MQLDTSQIISKEVQFYKDKSEIFPFDIDFTTKKTSFDIRKNGRRIWFQTGKVNLVYPYNMNKFKDDANEGFLSIALTEELASFLQKFDQSILQAIQTEFNGKKLGLSRKMTDDSIHEILKVSTDGGLFRLNVNAESNVIYELIDGKKMKNASSYIQLANIDTKSEYQFIVEPNNIWFMNEKLGIRWNCRQILKYPKPIQVEAPVKRKIVKSSDEGPTKKWLLDSDESDTRPSSSSNIPKAPNAPKKFLLDSSFGSDSDPKPVVKTTGYNLRTRKVQNVPKKKASNAPKKWILSSDSN